MQRPGLAAKVVELMDVGVFPASNPYAWLRLNTEGLKFVLAELAGDDETAETWIERVLLAARQGHGTHYMTSAVETITGGLGDECYNSDSEVRSVKQDLGTRRAIGKETAKARSTVAAVQNLNKVAHDTTSPVLRSAAESFKAYLQ